MSAGTRPDWASGYQPGGPGAPGGPAGYGPHPPAPPPAGGGGPKAVGILTGAVVVVALVIGGSVMLTGGSGKDSQASSAASAPAASSPSPTAAGQAAPAESDQPGAGAATGGQPQPSQSGLVPYVKLPTGACFDTPAFNSHVKEITIRSCNRPHDGEAIAEETLAGTFASDKELKAEALALCEPDARKRLRFIPRDGNEYYYYAIYPVLTTYQTQGESTVSCTLTLTDTVNGKQLSKPLP